MMSLLLAQIPTPTGRRSHRKRVTAVVSYGRRFLIPILGFEFQTETEEEQPSSDMVARKTVSVEKWVFVK